MISTPITSARRLKNDTGPAPDIVSANHNQEAGRMVLSDWLALRERTLRKQSPQMLLFIFVKKNTYFPLYFFQRTFNDFFFKFSYDYAL